jgi:DNA-binding MarR family transcriptional regulator
MRTGSLRSSGGDVRIPSDNHSKGIRAVPKLEMPPLEKHDFEVLADFRYQIRKFERFSETVTRQHGVTPLQYLLLLQVKGYPGRDWATVGELADRLQTQQHGVVALVSRCEKLGFVERRRSEEDRRRIEIHLLKDGQSVLNKLARLHRTELLSLHGRFVVPDVTAFGPG